MVFRMVRRRSSASSVKSLYSISKSWFVSPDVPSAAIVFHVKRGSEASMSPSGETKFALRPSAERRRTAGEERVELTIDN